MGPDHQTIGVYGMSETATCVTAARFDDPEPIRTGTFGRAAARHGGAHRRSGDAAQPLPRGETGEILVKGSTLMEGYYRVPRATTFDAEGFFRTGDRGYLDDGRQPALRRPHQGRHQDRRRQRRRGRGRGGARPPSGRAERRTSSACRDPVRGENIAAFVVLRPSQQRRRRRRCATSAATTLASYKVPRHVFVVDAAAVPRTGTGKVEKPALRRAAEALIAGDGSMSA